MKKRGFEIVSKFEESSINLPKRKTTGSAGYDFEAAVDIKIDSKKIAFVTTGIKAYMPKDEVLQMYPRSSLCFKKKLMLANSVGIIDSDYYNNSDNEGEIMLILYNFGDQVVEIKKGERIAQGIFTKYLTADGLETTDKRIGGFGSTGN